MTDAMSKYAEFYAEVTTNEETHKKAHAILGDKDLREASDEELEKLSALSEELPVAITVDELKTVIEDAESELREEELEAVAGGKWEVYGKITPTYTREWTQNGLTTKFNLGAEVGFKFSF